MGSDISTQLYAIVRMQTTQYPCWPWPTAVHVGDRRTNPWGGLEPYEDSEPYFRCLVQVYMINYAFAS